MKDKLISIINNPLHDNESIMSELVQIIHSYYKDNMLELFLQINEMDKAKLKEEKNLLYRGLQDGIHNTSIIAEKLLTKSEKEAISYTKYVFNSDNIASMINICKAYFPDGTTKGASSAGTWFFNQFKAQLIKHQDKYKEGGSSYDWVQLYNHEEYINLILNE